MNLKLDKKDIIILGIFCFVVVVSFSSGMLIHKAIMNDQQEEYKALFEECENKYYANFENMNNIYLGSYSERNLSLGFIE